MLTNVLEITTDHYASLITQALDAKSNLFVSGLAGTGKTAIPYQVAKNYKDGGLDVCYLNLSTMEAPDLLGLALIDEVDRVVDYATPRLLPFLQRDPKNPGKYLDRKPVLLLVDEIDKAKPELQNPLLEVFQSHTIAGRPLAIQGIVATGNLPDEGAHSQPVSLALTNRCLTYKLRFSFEPWREWAVSAGVNPLIVAFISKNQQELSRPPVDGDPTAYTRQSPRAWTLAGHDLDKCPEASIEFQSIVVAGRVGMQAANSFRVYLEHYRHIEPQVTALVDQGKAPDLKDMPIDRVMIFAVRVLAALVSKVNNLVEKGQKPSKASVHEIAKRVFGFLTKLQPDFQVMAVKCAMTIDFIKTWELTNLPEVMAVYSNIRKVIV